MNFSKTILLVNISIVIFSLVFLHVSYSQDNNDNKSDYSNNSNNSDNDQEENESSESIFERQEFINVRRAGGPEMTLPKNAYEKAVRQKSAMLKDENLVNSLTSTNNWLSVNPTGMFYSLTNNNYISGRTNSIAFDPLDANKFYIGAAQGGVWKTTDGGQNWNVLTDNLGSIASGDIAIDPSNSSILYYGTGELNYSQDSQYGDGIYKSTDAGLSWNKIVSASTVGSYISKIIIDPSNSARIYCSSSSGVFRSTNAGVSWTLTLSLNTSSLNISPADPQILYAASGNSGTVYKSTNGAVNWTQLTGGLPSGGGRTQLAISPDNANYLYASIATSGGSLLGLYLTTNAGSNWTLQNSSTNYMSSQGWYDNAVTVIPGNPNSVIVGGLDIYSSTNGGVTLTKKTTWSTSNASNFSHADIHFLKFNGSVLYCCSDGGIYKSTNNGTAWTDLNVKISTLQFQSADYDPSNIQKLYGGTQDNNKQTSTNSGVVWIQRTTGDGGYTIVDPVNTNYVYGQYVNGSIQRSNNSGVSFSSITPSGSSGGLFYNPYEMAPGNHNTVVFGRADVWVTSSVQTATTSSGWTQIATTSTIGGNISAIGISSTNTGKIYIGTSNGRILVTTNNGTSWTLQTGFSYVSDFWVDNIDDNICYVSFGGTLHHVYKTTNGGTSWFDISGNLPAIGTNSIVVKASATRTIFAGTDLGVFESTNEGASWISFNTGFPTVEVYDLKYKESAKLLLAATHGRGCFTFDFNNIILKLSLTINFEACPSTDSVTAELRNSASPYNLVESEKGLGGQGAPNQIQFLNAANGTPYYIVVRHKNSIAVWSKLPQSFSGNTLSYDFTTSSTQAFGNNLVNSGGKWSLYTGDINQDGLVDLSDVSGIDNDVLVFSSNGLTDLNCDGIVDLSDIAFADNNSFNFVSVIAP